ncbi:polysaccharide deacetylase family protein [Paenibacillus sp. sptzw28]|nr:polysaccharide deacetylase family protein [Paenibacillus sp. sptzw28]
MTIRMVVSLTMALLLVTGCSAGSGNVGSSQPASAPKQAPDKEKAAAPAGKTTAGQSKSTGEQASKPDEKVTAPGGNHAPMSPVKEKLYRMNQSYRFVPISKETTDKVVLLTFDDGPKEDEMISSLLDTLDKHKAKAIFFVNGYRVKQHPELLKKIAGRGQTIGNHSWDHIDLRKISPDELEKQIADVQKIVKEITGTTPEFFRPPFGLGGDKVRKVANAHGMLFTTWSDGSLDWDKSTKDKPDLVVKNVLDQLHPGANILMHELPWTVKALDHLLTKLEEKGYGFIDPETIDLGLPPRNVK